MNLAILFAAGLLNSYLAARHVAVPSFDNTCGEGHGQMSCCLTYSRPSPPFLVNPSLLSRCIVMDSKHISAPSVRADSLADESNMKVAMKDVDAVWQFVQNAGPVDRTIDDKKLVRKLDWMLMPLMFMCYYLQYTDKTLCK